MKRRVHRSTGTMGRNCAGLSLVELMVAVVLGLLILAAMLTAYNAGSATSSSNARFAEVQTNGRYAVDFLKGEIQHAGFLGLNAGPVQKGGATATSDYGCGAGFAAKLEEPVWGSNDATSTPLSCIASADFEASTDVLVIRRAGLTPGTRGCRDDTAGLAANYLYVRTEFMQATVFAGATAPPNLQPPVEDYPVCVDVYYISPYTKSAGDGVPALKRMILGSGPAMTSELVASGIENMQVQYGVRSGNTVSFVDAPGAADWPRVVAVRLWLLARSSDPEYSGFANKSTYEMADRSGGSAITVNDHYVRQMFALVVNLRR